MIDIGADLQRAFEEGYEKGKADGAMIYGNEHNCIMTIFGECSYAETGCGDCAVVEKVRKALSADRPQEWIPCSERLPEEEDNYLVTFGAFAETINGEKVIFGDIDGSVSEIGYGCYERDIFWHPTAFGWYDLATATPFDKRAIIAWMPLPKPWKGADDE